MNITNPFIQVFTVFACLISATANAEYDFRYKSSDHRINVFDDGVNTRMQLPEGTVVPAVLSLKTDGQKLQDLKRDGSFIVVPGLHQNLKLIWSNSREVSVVYTGASEANRLGVAASFGSLAPSANYGAVAKPAPAEHTPAKNKALQIQRAASNAEQVPTLDALESNVGSVVPVTVPATNQTPTPAAALPAPVAFDLVPPETIRSALQRWSAQAGWTFGPEFYAVNADIPVVTKANLGSDFKTAVRELLDSTGMGDVPVQPCFYANKVLRVVGRQELCSRP